MVGDAMAKVMKEKILPKYCDLAREEFVLSNVHPHEWKESASESIKDGDAWFDFSEMYVYGNLKKGGDPSSYQDVRLVVLDEGNNHVYDRLYTEKGKTSWNSDLTNQYVVKKKFDGKRYLPDKFNREGSHVLKQVCTNAQQRLTSHSELKEELKERSDAEIAKAISNSNKT